MNFNGESKPLNNQLRIAIPLADGKLANHFGHCEYFALVDVALSDRKIAHRQDVKAPPHEPGLLPPWLSAQGVTHIIAGGMGQRALGLFGQNGVNVIVGAPVETPEKLVTDFLNGVLESGRNVCDH
jgi:predicted Fe-Mo cluster-binding NifX family protein